MKVCSKIKFFTSDFVFDSYRLQLQVLDADWLRVEVGLTLTQLHLFSYFLLLSLCVSSDRICPQAGT